MFETRLKVLLFMLMFALAIVVARLVDMQVLHADVYRQQAEDALLLPAKSIPAVRGRILARNGEALASDEPCWDVLVHYGVLAQDEDYLRSLTGRSHRQKRYGPSLTEQEVEDRVRDEIARMWEELARFSGESVDDLQARRGHLPPNHAHSAGRRGPSRF